MFMSLNGISTDPTKQFSAFEMPTNARETSLLWKMLFFTHITATMIKFNASAKAHNITDGSLQCCNTTIIAKYNYAAY